MRVISNHLRVSHLIPQYVHEVDETRAQGSVAEEEVLRIIDTENWTSGFFTVFNAEGEEEQHLRLFDLLPQWVQLEMGRMQACQAAE